jgi:hypothetical protein
MVSQDELIHREASDTSRGLICPQLQQDGPITIPLRSPRKAELSSVQVPHTAFVAIGPDCTSPEKTDTSVFVFWLICCWVYKQKVMLRSRSQSGINGAPYGLPPFIPFARLPFAPPSAEEGSCNFFFRKSGSFSGL